MTTSELLTLDGQFDDGDTGFALRTASATEELALDDQEKPLFKVGDKARVRGHRMKGATVVDVVDIVLCPRPALGADLEPINCSSGPEHDEPEICSNGDATWLEANCPGVVVVF